MPKLWVDRSIHGASFAECPLGSGTGDVQRTCDNQDATPLHSCLGLGHDRGDTTMCWMSVRQAQGIWGVGVREQSVQLYGSGILGLSVVQGTQRGHPRYSAS